jgi:hypothetical protein
MNVSFRWGVWGVAVCMAVNIVMLIYSTNIHSDILFMKFLMDDLVSGGEWSSWRFSPAPSYFPDMILYALAYFSTKLVPLQILAITAAQVIIIGVVSIWLVRLINPKRSSLFQLVPLFFLLVSLVATSHYSKDSEIGIFFSSNNIQVPTMISSLLLLGLAIVFIQRPRKITALLFVMVGALGYASSAVFIICFLLPFMATLAVSAVYLKVTRMLESYQAILRLSLLFVFSQLFGYALSYVLTYNSPLNGRLPISLEGAKTSIVQLWKATLYLYDSSTPWSLFAAVVFLVAFLYSLINSGLFLFGLVKITRETMEVQTSDVDKSLVGKLIICVFFMFVTGSSIFGSVLSGGFVDRYGYRYFETFIAVSVILFAFFLERQLSEKSKSIVITVIVTVSLVGTIMSVYLLKEANKEREFSSLIREGAYNGEAKVTALCLDNARHSGVDLKAGIADYWMSRGVMFYMRDPKFILQSTDTLKPFFWISSTAALKYPEKYGAEVYNFVVADDGRYGKLMGYDVATISKMIPGGYSVISCEGSTSSILYYSSNALDFRLKAVHEAFLLSSIGSGSALYSGAELPGIVGAVVGSSRAATAADASGIMAYGPYIDLPSGKYVATLEFDSKPQSDSSVGRIEIGRFDSAVPTILYGGNLPSNVGTISAEFSVPEKGIEKLEVHVIFNGRGSLKINSLRLVGRQ